MQIKKSALSQQIQSRLSQPCPSSLGSRDRIKWQGYRASLRHLDTQVDNHKGDIKQEHLVSFGPNLGTLSQVSGPSVPGANVLSNAVGSGAMQSMANSNTRFLAMQNSVQHESRQYATISNVLKAYHETASAIINNTK